MRWLIVAGIAGIAAALYLSWDWLAAAGVASVLLAVAPCLAMCALGLCMRGDSKCAPSHAEARKTYETQSGEPPQRG
jgi:hypothetical protein